MRRARGRGRRAPRGHRVERAPSGDLPGGRSRWRAWRTTTLPRATYPRITGAGRDRVPCTGPTGRRHSAMSPQEEFVARAKRTDRAEARRRYRAELAQEAQTADDASTEGAAPASASSPRPAKGPKPATPAQPPAPARPSFRNAFRAAFRSPDLPGDL